MAVKFLHNDIRDKGLEQLSTPAHWQGSTLTLTVCGGTPPTRAAALALYPTGNRVVSEIALAPGDVSLGDRAGGGREVTVAPKTGVVTAVVSGLDLTYALYDGSRLLVVWDEPTDQALAALNNPIDTPALKVGFPNAA